MHDIELTGLDGSNLLGYLTALGTLRILSGCDADVRMSWHEKGWWMPVVHSSAENEQALLERLSRQVCGPETLNPACRIAKDLTLTRAQFTQLLERTAKESGPSDRTTADFLSALGSDAFGTGKNEQISDTEFRTMSGAGHQHFLGFMQELAEITDIDHLRRALFGRWDYADQRPSMRWDPADYRPHALRAEDPSGDPIKTMRGANRLAVEALPLFATAPDLGELRTTAFSDRDGATQITWPIWEDPLDVDTVRSLLSLEATQTGDSESLRRRGVGQVFQATRFTEGKYRNFSPARALL